MMLFGSRHRRMDLGTTFLFDDLQFMMITKEEEERKRLQLLKKSERDKIKKRWRMYYFISIVILAITVMILIPYFDLKYCNDVHQLNEKDIVQFLSSTVFGQEDAIKIVARALQTHKQNLEAGVYKPLILSFHGSSGVGKSFLSSQIKSFLNIISHTKPMKGVDLESCKCDFWKRAIGLCDWNILIYDDAQYLTEETQGEIKRKLKDIKGTCEDRKLLMIFETNLYGREINNIVFNKMKYQGQRTFDKSEFDSIINHSSSNFFVELHKNHLLDAFVPFLPLDRNSVVKCIKQELKRVQQIPHKDIAEEILKLIIVEKDLPFSNSGCKNVANKVALWLNSQL